MKYDPEQVHCLVDSHHGVYLPQVFVEQFSIKEPDAVDEEALAVLKEGPDNELYWEAWDAILGCCLVTIGDRDYYLHQDGDLFAIPRGMEAPE